jgi:two-component system NtrC family sensor kinase
MSPSPKNKGQHSQELNQHETTDSLATSSGMAQAAADKSVRIEDEGMYKAVFKSAADCILLIDKKGKILDFNDRLNEIGGYQKDELIGKNIKSLSSMVTKKSLAVMAANFVKRMANLPLAPYEVELYKKDRELVHVEIDARPLIKDGNIIGDLVLLRNITLRKKSEEEIRQKSSEIQIINSINEAANRGLSLNEIIEAVAEEIQKLYGGFATITYFLSEDKQSLVAKNFKFPSAMSRAIEKVIHMKMSDINFRLKENSIHSQTLKTGRVCVTNDIKALEKMSEEYTDDPVLQHILPMVVRIMGLRSVISVPLVSNGEAIGLLDIARHEPFPDTDTRRIQTIAGQFVNIIKRMQAEEALKLSERNFHNSIDRSLIGIHIVDINWNTLYANRALLDIYGFKDIEELKVNKLQDFYTEDSYKDWVERNAKLKRGEPIPDNIEVDIRRKDGTIRHVHALRKEVLWDGKWQYQVLYHDITERKLAEDAWRQSEQNLRNSFDNSPMGIRILDLEGQTIYSNQALLEVFGYANFEEAVKDPPQNFFTPESYAHFISLRDKRMSGEAIPDQWDVDIVRKDGVARHLQLYCKDVIWGGKKQLQVVYVDITERKKVENALKLSEENLKTSLDSLGSGVLIIDAETKKIVDINLSGAKIIGAEKSEIIGHVCHQFVCPAESGKCPICDFGQIVDNSEKILIRKNGERLPILKTVNTVMRDGRAYYIESFTDITPLKKAEEALKASENSFRSSLDNSPMGIRVSDKNDDTLYANQAFLNLFGYDNLNELKNSPPLQQYTPAGYADFVRRMEKQKAGAPRPDSVEIEIVRKDGQIRHLRLFTRELMWNGRQQYQNLYTDITDSKQAEEALKESEEKYRTIFESANDIIILLDVSGQILDVNSRLTQIGGYERSELIGKNILQLTEMINEQNIKIVVQNLQTILSTTGVFTYQIEMTKKNREPIFMEVNGVPIRKDDKIVGVLAFLRDITRRREIELALRESEEKYRTIFQSANDIILLMDIYGVIVDVNARLTEVSGYERNDLIGKPVKAMINIVSETNLVLVSENLKKTLEGSEGVTYQVEMLKKDRQAIVMEINSVPIKKDGKTVGVLAILRDITERQKAELQIREQKALTDRVLISTPDGVIVVGSDRRVIIANKAFERTLRLPEGSAAGKDVGEIIPVQALVNGIYQVLESGSSMQLEFRLKQGHIERILVADIISTQKNEVLAMLRDITDERGMQERLYLTDRLASVGEMAAGIAHELNNPLTGVVSLSQLLLETGVPEEMREDIKAISSEGQRAAMIVKNLLSFARSHAITTEPADINIIVQEVLSLRAYEHRVGNIQVVTKLDPGLPKILTDRFQIQQVFLNIVLNAEQAMAEVNGKGTLTITTEVIEAMVRISFANNGPVIAPDVINRIFDPFFTTKEVGKGTGLGLSICYGIVTNQGGKIYVRNEGSDGVVFIVELPVNRQ